MPANMTFPSPTEQDVVMDDLTTQVDVSETDVDPGEIMLNIYLAIGIFGMCDNSFVAVVLLTSKRLRSKVPNMFIISQSLLDFTVSFFIVLSNYFRDMSSITSRVGSELFCRLWLTNIGVWGFFISSSYNLIAMTVERYYGLVHPLRHSSSISKKMLVVVMAFIWLFGIAFNASYVATTSYSPQPGTCYLLSRFSSYTWKKVFIIVYSLIIFIIPLGIMIYCYSRIVYALKKSAVSKFNTNENAVPGIHEVKLNKAKRNVIKTMALMCGCFVFCWSWNTGYFVLFFWGVGITFNQNFYHFTVLAVFVNGCINPIVYAIKYDDFKTRVVYLLFGKCQKSENGNEINVYTTSSRV